MAETAAEKVALLDPHDVEIEVDAEHAHILESLGWVRAEAKREAKEPSRRAKILPAGADDEEEEPPPKSRARRD